MQQPSSLQLQHNWNVGIGEPVLQYLFYAGIVRKFVVAMFRHSLGNVDFLWSCQDCHLFWQWSLTAVGCLASFQSLKLSLLLHGGISWTSCSTDLIYLFMGRSIRRRHSLTSQTPSCVLECSLQGEKEEYGASVCWTLCFRLPHRIPVHNKK